MSRKITWEGLQELPPVAFKCGYCGMDVAPNKGWGGYVSSRNDSKILVCHNCSNPSYFSPEGQQSPGPNFGNDVKNISDLDISSLYEEARKAAGAGSYTACVLCCRKLLMHIAVAKGAKEGVTFVKYVEFFADNNYIPPDAKVWVDYIRQKGNEANHEILLMSTKDAQNLLAFSEMLLKVVYEFPFSVKSRFSTTT